MNHKLKPFPVALITMLALALPHLVTLASEPSSDSLRDPSAWEWRFPKPTGLELHDIVYGDGQFVAVGDRGTVLTSNDGIKWSGNSLGEEDLHAVAYGDGKFVAAGSGVVMISSDAVDWTPHTVTDQPLLYDIEFAAGLWVAVGNGGYILSSPDAEHWTVRERLQTSAYRAVVHGAGRWMALGNGVSVSDEGETWTEIENPPQDTLRAAIYREGEFFAVGIGNNQQVYTSKDGKSWVIHESGTTRTLYDVLFAHGRFIAVGSFGRIQSSTDFSEWVEVDAGSQRFEHTLNALAHANGITVAVGRTGITRKTTNGSEWTPTPDRWRFHDITHGNGRFLAAGNPLAVSEDGEEWDFHPVSSFVRAVVWADGHFLLSGSQRLYTSGDGESLEEIYVAGAEIFGLGYEQNMAIAVGENGTVVSSSDLENWSSVSAGTSEHLFGVTSGGGRIVAVGAEGTVVYSDDGEKWHPGDSSVDYHLFDVAYGDGRFIAVGQEGMLLSIDGETWLPDNSMPSRSFFTALLNVTHANNTFVVLGSFGRILVRPDGGKWKDGLLDMPSATTTTPENGWSRGPEVAFGGGRFVIAGRNILKQSIEVPSLSHISVEYMDYEAGMVEPGESIDFSTGLRNTGGATADFQLQVILSRSGELNDSNNVLVDTIDQSPLDPGVFRLVDSTLTLDSAVSAGIYHVLVAPVYNGSPQGAFWRSETADVFLQRSDPDRPNLEIVSVDAPEEWTGGAAEYVTVEITNSSESPITPGESFSTEVFLGREPGPGHPDDLLIGEIILEELAANDSETKVIETVLPPGVFQGDYYLKVAVNRNGAVAENEYSGNVFISSSASKEVFRGITHEAVAAASNHAAAIRKDGSLWVWGENAYGQVGDGTFRRRLLPVRIGDNNDWASVSAGLRHTLALKSDGSLWAWGANGSGQLGIGTFEGTAVPERVGTANDWVAVSAGAYHSLGLRADGSLWAWGDNEQGSLGDGTQTDQPAPVQIGNDTDWVAIAADQSGEPFVPRSSALKAEGTLWYWAVEERAWFGEDAAISPSIPTRLEIISNWASLYANRQLTAMTSDGEIRPLQFRPSRPAISPAMPGTGWMGAKRGSHHILAFKKDGSLWTWGSNLAGELGDGSTEAISEPFRIYADNGSWVAATGGERFSVAKKSDGSIWSWGANDRSQLGQGDLDEYLVPTEITFIKPASATDYESWSAEYFSDAGSELAAWDAAPAGLPNLQAYLLDLDPWNPDHSRLPAPGIAADSTTGERYLTITYTRTRNREGVIDLIETSPNLDNWEALPEANVQIIEQTAETETLLGSTPVSSETAFLRVRVVPEQ